MPGALFTTPELVSLSEFFSLAPDELVSSEPKVHC